MEGPVGKAKGGAARALALTAARRKEIAMKGVAAKKERAALPQATHAGELKIGDVTLACSVLDDGSRVLSLRGINTAFGGSIGGSNTRTQDGVRNLPRILNSKSIRALISNDFMARLSDPKEFKPMHGGRSAFGYDASLLPEMCEVILDANKIDAVRSERAAKIAETLLRGFARVGIIALVDEATGYEKDRVAGSLAKILEAFIAKELQPWVKTFPADYYEQLFRLRGLPYSSDSVKRPQYFGVLTNDIVYKRLAPGVLEELKKVTERADDGRLKHKLFQKLTGNIGYPKLREHLGSVVTIMKLSNNYQDFKNKLAQIHPVYGHTISLPLDYESEKDTGKGL
jgi:hypothetical protein